MRLGLHILAILLLSWSFSPLAVAQDNAPKAQKGVLDLRNWDFDKQPVIKLNGEWEFYWEKLLTPQDFNPQKYSADAYVEMPKYWSQVRVNGNRLPSTGYATYRLIILSNQKGRKLKLIIPAANSAMKAWWNNEFLGESGKVNYYKNGAKPSLTSINREVTLDSPKVQLIIQVSNFEHREGGFFYSPRLGVIGQVEKWQLYWLIINVFLIGGVIIMAIYHLGLFLMRPRNFAALSFFLFSILLAVRLLFTENFLLTLVLPSIDFDWKYRIEYLTFFFIPPLFNYYVYQVVKDKFIKKLLIVLLILAIIASFSLIAKPIFFTRLMPYYQVVYLIMILLDTYIIIKHWLLKTPGADILLVTFILIFLLSINDILLFLRVIDSIELAPLAIFILVLGQSLVLASIFTKAFKQNERLRQELEFKSKNLEKIVQDRTAQIERQKRKLERQNQLLQQQTEQLELKDQLLTSSLQYAAALLKAIMPDPQILNNYFDNFILFLPKDIVSGDGYWFSDKNPNYIFLAVYDCTGHGVPAAFLSIIATYLLNTIIIEQQQTEPNEILDQIDQKLKAFLLRQGKDGMEMIVLRIEKDQDEPQIKFASAKLELFYFNSRTRLVTRHRGARRALGYSSLPQNPEKFSNFILSFKKNDAIYMLSDGYIDQVNKEKKRFGTENLMELLRKIGDKPMWQQKQILHETIIDYMDDTKQRDDIIVVGIKNAPYKPEQQTTTNLSL